MPGGHRMSTTANLVKVRRVVWDAAAGRNRSCEAFLGVGHTHRAEGFMNRMYKGLADFTGLNSKSPTPRAKRRGGLPGRRGRKARAAKAAAGRRLGTFQRDARAKAPFNFGYQYTHFLVSRDHAPNSSDRRARWPLRGATPV